MARTGPGPTDEERDEAVRFLDAALLEGQLDSEEHERRLTTVLETGDARKVRWQLMDLQRPAALEPTAVEQSRDRVRAAWSRVSTRHRLAVAGGVLAFGAVVGLAVVQGHDPEPTGYSAVAADPTSADRISEFVEAYEEEFGTTLAGRVQLDGDYALVDVPVPDEPTRYETRHLQSDAFNDYGQNTHGDPPVDLADIDVAAAQRSLDRAWEQLDVQDPESTTILVSTDGRLTFVVRNRFEEEGRLVTDLAGTELSRDPFVPPPLDD